MLRPKLYQVIGEHVAADSDLDALAEFFQGFRAFWVKPNLAHLVMLLAHVPHFYHSVTRPATKNFASPPNTLKTLAKPAVFLWDGYCGLIHQSCDSL